MNYYLYRNGGVPRVEVVNDGSNKLLDPAQSQKIYNHSPDGFEWGYGGSGPAQLALAILLHHTGNRALALAKYQDFKWQFIAAMDKEGGTILGRQIDEFLKAQPHPV